MSPFDRFRVWVPAGGWSTKAWAFFTKASRSLAPKASPLRSKLLAAFSWAEPWRLEDHMGLPSTWGTASSRRSARTFVLASRPLSEAEDAGVEASEGLLATAEGRSQAASKTSAAPALNQTRNPAIMFSPCTAK